MELPTVRVQEDTIQHEHERLSMRVETLTSQIQAAEREATRTVHAADAATRDFALGAVEAEALTEATHARDAAAVRLAMLRDALAVVSREANGLASQIGAERSQRLQREHEVAAAPLREEAAACVARFADEFVAALEAPALRVRAEIAAKMASEFSHATPLPPLDRTQIVDAIRDAVVRAGHRELDGWLSGEPNFSVYVRDVLAGPHMLRPRWAARFASEFYVTSKN